MTAQYINYIITVLGDWRIIYPGTSGPCECYAYYFLYKFYNNRFASDLDVGLSTPEHRRLQQRLRRLTSENGSNSVFHLGLRFL